MIGAGARADTAATNRSVRVAEPSANADPRTSVSWSIAESFFQLLTGIIGTIGASGPRPLLQVD